MFAHLIQAIEQAPARLSRERLGRRARVVRSEGEERLWRAQTSALERVGAWLQDAPREGVLGPIAGAAESLVQRRLETLTAVPIPDYDALNARDASRAVRELQSRVALHVVARHEEATKHRKTVLRAVEEQLARLERPEPPEQSGGVAEPATT